MQPFAVSALNAERVERIYIYIYIYVYVYVCVYIYIYIMIIVIIIIKIMKIMIMIIRSCGTDLYLDLGLAFFARAAACSYTMLHTTD